MSEFHWTSQEDILERVRTGMAAFIYGEQAAKAGAFDEAEFKDIRDIYNLDNPPRSFERPGDYSHAFKMWFSQYGHIYHSLKSGGNIQVSRQWTLDNRESISISIGGNFHIANAGTLDRITEGLTNILEGQFTRLNAKLSKEQKPNQSKQNQNLQQASNAQIGLGQKVVFIKEIDTLYQDGRKMVRAYGDPYMRYGIPLYQEGLAQIGLNEQELAIGVKIPVKRSAVVDMSEKTGKPARIAGWLPE